MSESPQGCRGARRSLEEAILWNIQNNDFTTLKSQVEELKIAMKDMVATKPLVDNDPMSNLNDL